MELAVFYSPTYHFKGSKWFKEMKLSKKNKIKIQKIQI